MVNKDSILLWLVAFLFAIIFRVTQAEDLLFHTDYTGFEDYVARKLNLSYKTVNASEWAKMGTKDFSKYKAIIIGDPILDDPNGLAALERNRKNWTAAVTGNIILIGTDTSNHYNYAIPLMQDGITFAAGGNGTGLYMSLSKYFGGETVSTVKALDPFGIFLLGGGPLNKGSPNGTDSGESCWDEIHIVSKHKLMTRIGDENLSNWSCSVHEVFYEYPQANPDFFLPIAIVEGVTVRDTPTFADGTSGTPYIIGRSPQLTPISAATKTSGNSTAATPPSSPSNVTQRSSNTERVVGIAVGCGLGAIVIIALAVFLFLRKRKSVHKSKRFELGGQEIFKWNYWRRAELPVLEPPVEIAGSDQKHPVEMAAASENANDPVVELDGTELKGPEESQRPSTQIVEDMEGV
ncbi:hypothetical protein H072_6258 [Dactylellina haptotyla CBS 200.50]|uniref:Uncharacterized protein n=1 Tax=Dactylellina haptotyla (strain CBS 200.50) TaxID=1284197 RepID=S8BKF4_DACHA|nr:hypothetical protein H072_6258 [Dactylellina haptotyla CBS 200.50]